MWLRVAQPTPGGARLSSGQSLPLSHTRLQAHGSGHQEQRQDVLLLGTGGKPTPARCAPRAKALGRRGDLRGEARGTEIPQGMVWGAPGRGPRRWETKRSWNWDHFPTQPGLAQAVGGHTRTQPHFPATSGPRGRVLHPAQLGLGSLQPSWGQRGSQLGGSHPGVSRDSLGTPELSPGTGRKGAVASPAGTEPSWGPPRPFSANREGTSTSRKATSGTPDTPQGQQGGAVPKA